MDPMLPLLGIKMEAVAIVGKSLGLLTHAAMWSKLNWQKKQPLYIYIY
jgi:hypothetical protein